MGGAKQITFRGWKRILSGTAHSLSDGCLSQWHEDGYFVSKVNYSAVMQPK